MKSFREEEQVRLARDEAECRWPRALDAWEAITWTLLHDETCGDPLDDIDQVRGYVWDGARSKGLPTVEVIYEIQRELIIVHHVEFRDAKYGQAGHA